jgi:hypothetical protein
MLCNLLSDIMLYLVLFIVMLSVIRLSVIMLNVVAPVNCHHDTQYPDTQHNRTNLHNIKLNAHHIDFNS